jgi:hypothetical protein
VLYQAARPAVEGSAMKLETFWLLVFLLAIAVVALVIFS